MKGRWVCEGYPARSGGGNGTPRVFISIQPRRVSSGLTTIRQPSASLSISDAEFQYLLLFRKITADPRTGFFYSEFWTRIILQESHSSPAVKHALIAIGALYRALELSNIFSLHSLRSVTDAATHHDYAVTQYGKAISLMRKHLKHGKPNSYRTALISCVLFYCVESFLGEQGAAVAQIHSGIMLLAYRLQKVSSSKGQYSDGVEDGLIEMLRDIANSIKSYDLTFHRNITLPMLISSTVRPEDVIWAAPEIPISILTVNQATVTWGRLKRYALQFVQQTMQTISGRYHISSTTTIERMSIAALMTRYASVLEDLLVSERDTPHFLCLQATKLDLKMTQILFQSAFEKDQTYFDIYETEFAGLLDLIQETLDYRDASVGSKVSLGRPALFTVDPAIIYPLFFIATRCRMTAIRSRAIALLSSNTLREGLWDSALAAKVATLIMDIEEAGRTAQGELAEGARVTLNRVTFEDMGKVTVVSCVSSLGVVQTMRLSE